MLLYSESQAQQHETTYFTQQSRFKLRVEGSLGQAPGAPCELKKRPQDLLPLFYLFSSTFS